MQLAKILFAVAGLAARALAQDGYSDQPIGTTNQCITPRACFMNDTDTTVTYCVTTSWVLTWPTILRNHFQTAGYSLVDYNAMGFDKCGWNFGESVSKLAVARGTIYYASVNASLDFRPTDLLPRIDNAIAVMQNNYPGLEIGLILGFSFLAVLLFFLQDFIARGLRSLRNHRFNKRRMARVPTPARVQPSLRTEKTWPSTLRSGASSAPPPPYGEAAREDV